VEATLTTPRPLLERRELIAGAALQVLAADGGRALTHRAVDRCAAIPEGSTSNYFPTREALLTAALQRLVALERPSVQALEALVPSGPYSPRRSAELLGELIVDRWLDGFSDLALARYELILEARRRPQFRREFDAARREYLRLVERLLPTAGCRDPGAHAPQLLALLDGLLVNQLLQPATALPRAAIVDHLRRFFESC